jgi:enoyl-CoA hydratase/carnithine racemase
MTDRTSSLIGLHRVGDVVVLTIGRPEVHNALDGPTCDALGAHLDAAEADAGIRVVVITGKGDKAFCAGFDLKWADAHPEVYQDPLFASQVVRRGPRTKPIICAVNGIAMGLGFELALAGDLIVAAPHAKFALPEPKVGLVAMGGGVIRLARQIGLKQALGVTLTARTMTAEEGLRLGFVNEVATGDVVTCALGWAHEILQGGPLSIAATLAMAEAATRMPLEEALDPRRHPAAMRVLASEDAQEGRRAFLARRSPEWKGR